jgi:hypothetical protein
LKFYENTKLFTSVTAVCNVESVANAANSISCETKPFTVSIPLIDANIPALLVGVVFHV